MPEQTDSTQHPAARPAGLWILIPLAALTLGGLGVVWMQLDRQADRMRQLEEEHARVAHASGVQLSNLDAAVRQMNVTIEQQGSLLSRIVGTVVPMRIPESTENELARIESKLAETDTLAASKDETATLARKFTTLIDSLPPWIQAELLPRIVPVRWQLDALQLMHRELPENAEILHDLAGDLVTHAANRPQASPETLVERLQTHAANLTAEATKLERRSAIERAEKALSGEGDPSVSLMELETLTDAPEAEELQQKLRVAVLLRQAKRIEGDAALLPRLADPVLKARLATTIHSTIQDLLITVTALNIKDPELTERLSRLTADAQGQIQAYQADSTKRNAARARAYQLWALEQIRSVPKFEKLGPISLAKITDTIARNNPFGEEREGGNSDPQDELAQILIARLSVIDLNLLDKAVGEWYSKVFTDRFGKLDEARQIRVVEGFANSIKRPLEDLP
ncbi:MAG: hypothetical protein KF731_05735 [Thauera sp.]|nr:hypothetical protein [Thauera sp.]